MGSLPARFEPNVGQAGSDIAFTLKTKGYRASLGPGVIHFSLPEGRAPGFQDHSTAQADQEPVRSSVVSMRFLGANPNPVVEARDPQAGVSNYLIGNDPAKWQRDVPGYSKIYYRELYLGIDMVIYDDAGDVRYDFELSPGADPDQIEIEFVGAEDVEISDTGDLVISAPYGELTQEAPHSYQSGQELRSAFVTTGETTAGFVLGKYDHTRALTIDPAITYSSYLGGSGEDRSWGLAVDGAGSVYVTGQTESADFPTASAYDTTLGGDSDAFVTKFAPDGQSLAYSTYLGGAIRYDSGGSIGVDITGSVYVTGYTGSEDFPVVTPFQAAKAAGLDIFLTKLAPDGASLTYSTYLGGDGYNDEAHGLAIDSAGSAYVTGNTSSTDLPLASAYDTTLGGGWDAFLTKFAPDGQSLVFSTYLGGSGGIDDVGHGITVDASGSAYVTGKTNSPDFPVVNAYDSTYGATSDGFLTKFAPDGQSLIYSTYLGGTGTPGNLETAMDVAVDSLGSAYVVGGTNQSNFPVINAYDATLSGTEDGFLTKFAPDGQSLIYSTYLGGTGQDGISNVAVDGMGNVYLSGGTFSSDFPTQNAFQTSHGGGIWDGFLTKFAPDGQSLIYSTYLGGSAADGFAGPGGSMAMGPSGQVYGLLQTNSGDLPLVSPYQGANSGSFDAYVVRISAGEVISGTFTGGIHGSISVYGPTGNLVAYSCCMTSDFWYVDVPAASCPAGYKILWLPPDNSKQAKWFNAKDNYSSAECVSAPSSGNDMTIPSAGVISGYVKDKATAADIDGAYVYAFKASDGTYAGYARSGAGGVPGRFEFVLDSSTAYKFRAIAPGAYVPEWFSGAANFSVATPTTPPSSAINFSLSSSAAISGYVKDGPTAADLNGYPVYVYSASGTFVGYAVTDRGFGQGRYSVNVTGGVPYKLLSVGGPYGKNWFSGATSFTESTTNAAPLTANFSMS